MANNSAVVEEWQLRALENKVKLLSDTLRAQNVMRLLYNNGKRKAKIMWTKLVYFFGNNILRSIEFLDRTRGRRVLKEIQSHNKYYYTDVNDADLAAAERHIMREVGIDVGGKDLLTYEFNIPREKWCVEYSINEFNLVQKFLAAARSKSSGVQSLVILCLDKNGQAKYIPDLLGDNT